MATLTTAQVHYIRDSSGDEDHEIDEDRLQAIYDSATEGNSVLDDTVYYVVRRRYALAAAGVSTGTPSTGLQTSKQQKFEQLGHLLNLWAGITGLPGTDGVNAGALRFGVISLGIDSVEDA